MGKYSIDLIEVTKKYGANTILSNLNLSLSSGNIYGIVGRNGSGKTMLLKCICGFVTPTFGIVKISYNGKALSKDKNMNTNMGIIIENPGFLKEYNGYQNLKLLSIVQGGIENQEIVDTMRLVGLDPKSKKKVGKYSMGMRQKLGIAQALLGDPNILLLDEPMNGLDEDSVKMLRELLLALKVQDKLIVLASHSKEDIEILCDEVFLMQSGKIEKIL